MYYRLPHSVSACRRFRMRHSRMLFHYHNYLPVRSVSVPGNFCYLKLAKNQTIDFTLDSYMIL